MRAIGIEPTSAITTVNTTTGEIEVQNSSAGLSEFTGHLGEAGTSL